MILYKVYIMREYDRVLVWYRVHILANDNRYDTVHMREYDRVLVWYRVHICTC